MMERQDEARSAIGPRADYYLGRWAKMDADGSAISWNWAACLLNLYWLAYRKIWAGLALFVLANILLAVAGAALPALGRFIHVPMIALTFVIGAYGNHLYRRKIEHLVSHAKDSAGTASHESLRRRGGTSTAAVAIALVLSAAAIVAGAAQQWQQLQASKSRR